MSSRFLEHFAATVVERLTAAGLLEVGPAGEEAVARHVAARLGEAKGASLISSISRALVTCADVEELYAEDDDIKAIVTDLDRRSAGL